MQGVSVMRDQNTFKNCTGLTSVTLPSSVNDVRDSSFWGCTNITEFNVNSYLFNFNVIVRDMNITNLNFNYNGKLPKIQIINLENVILSGITSIDDDAFALCINLLLFTINFITL